MMIKATPKVLTYIGADIVAKIGGAHMGQNKSQELRAKIGANG
jgi:hypothetical protein